EPEGKKRHDHQDQGDKHAGAESGASVQLTNHLSNGAAEEIEDGAADQAQPGGDEHPPPHGQSRDFEVDGEEKHDALEEEEGGEGNAVPGGEAPEEGGQQGEEAAHLVG